MVNTLSLVQICIHHKKSSCSRKQGFSKLSLNSSKYLRGFSLIITHKDSATHSGIHACTQNIYKISIAQGYTAFVIFQNDSVKHVL